MNKFDEGYFREHNLVLGIDEVGRGPLAGDVVVCGVVMNMADDKIVAGVRDSKKLTEKKREALFEEIMANAVEVIIARRSPEEIDRVNILNATKQCMAEIVEKVQTKVDAVLVDYVNIKGENLFPIVKGDDKSYNIACASIVAKVTRDREMVELARQYPHYAFERNKGYGTKAHYAGIEEFGLSKIHRRSFTKKYCEEE